MLDVWQGSEYIFVFEFEIIRHYFFMEFFFSHCGPMWLGVNTCRFFLGPLSIVDYLLDCCRRSWVFIGRRRSMQTVIDYFFGNYKRVAAESFGPLWTVSMYLAFLVDFSGLLWFVVDIFYRCGLLYFVVNFLWIDVDSCGVFFGLLWAVPCFSEEEILNKILIAQILNHKDGYVLKYLC